MVIDWIEAIETVPVQSICLIENKTPLEVVSEPVLKASLIKMMSEMTRVGHFIGIDFPENFINHNLRKASLINENTSYNLNECIDKMSFIINLADEKKIMINQNKKILNILKDKNG